MKKLFFLCAIITATSAGANDKTIDSLLRIFEKAPADSHKIKTAILISAQHSNVDHSLYWANHALSLSKKYKWRRGEGKSHDQVSAVYNRVSNYPKVMEHLLPALEISEETGDYWEAVALLRKIGRVFAKQGDYDNALVYYRRVVQVCRQNNFDERIVHFQLGSAYDNKEQLDSALMYYQRAYEYISSKGEDRSLAGVLSHLGALHMKMNNLPLALSYGRMAVTAFDTYNINESGSAYRHLADIFVKAGNRDSARFYAHKTLAHARRIGSPDLELEAVELLASLSDDAEAAPYYRTALALREQLFSKEKSAEIANLNFNQRQREAEIKNEKEQLAQERKQNIQYAAIAIGLLLFVVIYLLFSHSIVAREKPVRFLGILSLLMVFEFINLVIHPYVGNLTHHSPLWMLLVMVCIAALLIPLHHRIEKWVVQRMVDRNRKIRLKAAKKTIAKLEGVNPEPFKVH